ncbi:MAG: methylmalonyl Co-A mutase-associated GTPase MeaB [Anaerolineales bacterium]
MSLVESALSGDRLALTRLLTQVENNTAEGRLALATLFPRTGKAHLIGVTGAPGTGKSSLVNRLALYYRAQGKRVAVVAVDPSSPFTGGAVLGDRVRMRDLAGDRGVFIRSMASRGSLGGLAQATAGLVQVFDAVGFEMIIIETVGAGQSEVDIARLAHTTVVVEAPGLGDDIQAIKAGILEIADILAVNKADRPGVENTLKALKNALELAHPVRHVFRHHGKLEAVEASDVPAYNSWIPPIQKTVATTGEGVPELAAEIARHAEHLRQSGDWAARERSRLGSELETLLREALFARFREQVSSSCYDQALEQVYQRQLAPVEAVEILMSRGSK